MSARTRLWLAASVQGVDVDRVSVGVTAATAPNVSGPLWSMHCRLRPHFRVEDPLAAETRVSGMVVPGT